MCGPVSNLSPAHTHAAERGGAGVLCAVTEREVKQLWRLFKEIDLDQDGKVSPSEMITIPQLEFNPLGKRVVTRAMTKRSSDNLSFKVRARHRTHAYGHGGWQRPTVVGVRLRLRLRLLQRLRHVRRAPCASQDFALALSVFAPDAPYEQKLKLAFDMFDFDGDKAIGRSDLEVSK